MSKMPGAIRISGCVRRCLSPDMMSPKDGGPVHSDPDRDRAREAKSFVAITADHMVHRMAPYVAEDDKLGVDGTLNQRPGKAPFSLPSLRAVGEAIQSHRAAALDFRAPFGRSQ